MYKQLSNESNDQRDARIRKDIRTSNKPEPIILSPAFDIMAPLTKEQLSRIEEMKDFSTQAEKELKKPVISKHMNIKKRGRPIGRKK